MDLELPSVFFEAAYDEIHVGAGATARVFEDGTDDAPPVHQIDEEQLLHWAFSRTEVATAIAYAASLPAAAHVAIGTRRVDIDEQLEQGDFDVIAGDRSHPQAAIALECKRIKATLFPERGFVVNKLPDINRAIHQTNVAIDAGFSRAALLVIAQVDARPDRSVNFFHRGLRREDQLRVIRYPRWDLLNPAAGVAYVEVTQAANKPIEVAGTVVAAPARLARHRRQPDELTNRVARLLERSKYVAHQPPI